jgi:signal transduction histidine kinase
MTTSPATLAASPFPAALDSDLIALAHASRAGLSRAQFENLCHEIRAPLSCVLGIARLALNQCDVPATRAHLEDMFHTLDGLVRLLGEALTAAVADQTLQPQAAQVFQPQALLDDLRSLFAAGAQLRGLRFVCEADMAHHAGVVGDPARIKQVLLNLLINALKFTPRGSVVLSLQLRRQGSTHARLVCRVRDTGVGMAPADIAHVLQRHGKAQPRDAGTEVFAGHGLGLAICQDLLHSMGSNLQVQSHPSLGSEFSFALTLPGAQPPLQLQQSLASVAL